MTASAYQARLDLIWIAGRWPTLEKALTPGSNSAITGMPSAPSTDPASPINVHVSDLMREIESSTRAWAKTLIEATKWKPSTSTMPWLLFETAEAGGMGGPKSTGHFDPVTPHGAAFCQDAHHYRTKVENTLTPPGKAAYIGPCPGDGQDGSGCAGDLYAREDEESGTCRECGEPWTRSGQYFWLQGELSERLMTPSEIVHGLNALGHVTPPGTVKTWIHKGKLEPAEEGLYRLSEAVHLRTTTRTRQRLTRTA